MPADQKRSMPNSKIKNKKAHSQAREIIWNVYNYFKEKNEYFTERVLYSTTADATGYSARSVQRIVLESKKNINLAEIPVTPNKIINKVTKVNAIEDNSTEDSDNVMVSNEDEDIDNNVCVKPL